MSMKRSAYLFSVKISRTSKQMRIIVKRDQKLCRFKIFKRRNLAWRLVLPSVILLLWQILEMQIHTTHDTKYYKYPRSLIDSSNNKFQKNTLGVNKVVSLIQAKEIDRVLIYIIFTRLQTCKRPLYFLIDDCHFRNLLQVNYGFRKGIHSATIAGIFSIIRSNEYSPLVVLCSVR